jgi:hypothetical protein
MRHFNDWITEYLRFTHETEPAFLYRLYAAIYGISASLQRKCWINWHEEIYPNVYFAFSGPSGSRKNTAINPIQKMLREITDVRLSPLASRRGLSISMQKAKQDTPYQGSTSGIIVHSSLAIIATELAVLFGRDSEDMIKSLVNWYDCQDSFDYLTATQGEDKVIGVCLTMAGGITPELISSTIKRDVVGTGLFSRMMFIFAPRKGQISIFPFKTKKDLDTESKLIEDLYSINKMVGYFTITESFMDKYAPWYTEHDSKGIFRNTPLSSYSERRQVHLLKLCMISSASRGDSFEITAEDFDRVVSWLVMAEKEMLKPFSGFGKNELAQFVQPILASIVFDKETSTSKLINEFYNDLTKEEMMKILFTLQQMGEIKMERTGTDYKIVKLTGEQTS